MLPRGVVVLLGAASLLVTTLALQRFSSILGPVLLALVMVIGIHPLTVRLHKRGAPLWLATGTSMIALFVIIVGLAGALALSVAQLGTLLPTYQDSFAALIEQARDLLARAGIGQDQLQSALSSVSFSNVAGIVGGLVTTLASTFSNVIFLIFVALFMIIDATSFTRRLNDSAADRPEIVNALVGFAHGTRRYLVVSTVFGLIVAVADTVVLWIAGIPLAVLWGLLAFITNYIPNIGFIIGLVPPALLALLEGGPQLMIIVIVAYIVLNFIFQSVIQPKYVGDAVDMSLTVTFLSLVLWSFVLGGLGAILAIPLTLLAKALLLDVDPNTRWISNLVGGSKPKTPPDTPPAEVPDGTSEA